ncbi:SubName: Full=Uncharacterized protein {ECO:0000313/EMBL:CCA68350.1} [Serendipita indica DSM 11827]|nr:SubName: Full=Uncharacterized protein {ECO:0000313/EMBL:CCA68350.1} [Serendipita indica DSM 11827]
MEALAETIGPHLNIFSYNLDKRRWGDNAAFVARSMKIVHPLLVVAYGDETASAFEKSLFRRIDEALPADFHDDGHESTMGDLEGIPKWCRAPLLASEGDLRKENVIVCYGSGDIDIAVAQMPSEETNVLLWAKDTPPRQLAEIDNLVGQEQLVASGVELRIMSQKPCRQR